MFFFFFGGGVGGGGNEKIMQNHLRKDLNQIKWSRSFHCLNTQHRESSRKSKFVDVDKRKIQPSDLHQDPEGNKNTHKSTCQKSQAPRTLVA
jgi:hypothetical protein